MGYPIAIYKGVIKNDAFYFAPIINGERIFGMILDTGAFELTFSQRVADRLSLPNLGTLEIGGIGGTVNAYLSECTITIRDRVYPEVPCVVDPQLTDLAGLFGLRFFVDNQIKLELNPVRQTLVLFDAYAGGFRKG